MNHFGQSTSRDQLVSLIRAQQSSHEISPGVVALADAARQQHGDSVQAVLFYGSCLRTGNVRDGLADLYLLVDDYRSAFNSRTLAFFNKLLPPNVFYLEVAFEGHLLRAKYAVLTLTDFRKGAEHWFHSYLWGRFSQKSGMIYARDETVVYQVQEALVAAAQRFVEQTLPRMGTQFTARDLWSTGLSLSYRSELRTEKPGRAVERIFDADPDYYQALAMFALNASPYTVLVQDETEAPCYSAEIPALTEHSSRISWCARFIQGKILSVLRLLKGLLTFKGGVDYILWKIERHSGVKVEVGPALKRIPAIAVVVIFWRLYWKKAFR